VAALVSGPIVDALTIFWKQNVYNEEYYDEVAWNQRAWTLTSSRAIILTGIFANIIACLVTISVREIKVDESPSTSLKKAADDEITIHNKSDCSVFTDLQVSEFVPHCGTPMEIFRETVRLKSFWRFLLVCLITVNIRMIYRHLDATFPKYMVREFGRNVPKGTIYSINPALIIILVPMISATTDGIDPLVLIHHGSYVSAFSVFILALATSVPASILFVVVLSIGEAMWSPRLYDYTMSVVKEGREGTHMALSSAPLFLAKLPVGFMSGYLLQEFCPKEGERHSRIMWLIIGLTTAMSPVLLTIFWADITTRSDDTESVVMTCQNGYESGEDDINTLASSASDIRGLSSSASLGQQQP